MNGETDPTLNSPVPDTQPEKQNGGDTALFTQEQLNHAISERVKREREAATARILKDLGVESLDLAKEALNRHKEAENAKKTDLERWEAEKAALAKERDDLKAMLDGMKAEAVKRERTSALSSALREAKATDIDDLLVLVGARFTDEVAAVLTEDGKVSETSVKALVSKVKETYPKFFTALTTPGSPSNKGGKPVEPDAAAKKQAANRQLEILRRTF